MTATTADLTALLTAACGTSRVRRGAAGDAIGTLTPAHVVRPADTAAVSAVMVAASRHGLAVVPRGAGTKLGWANPPGRLDVVVDMTGLDTVVEHAPGDLIARIEPGVPLARLQSILASAGQCLAVDEVVPGSTVGGVIATGLSGPRRPHYGAIRDLLIGITVVRADGVVAHSGGRVVKNVAGYDLCKLYAGSYGTLGIITEATFRLHPIPPARAYVRGTYANVDAAGPALGAAIGSTLAPSAVEVRRAAPDGAIDVEVLVEGSIGGVLARAHRMAGLLGADAIVAAQPQPEWATIPGPATIRVTTEIARVADLLDSIAAAARETGVRTSTAGSAYAGVLYVGFPWETAVPAARALLDALRSACAARGGFATLVSASPEVRSGVDAWGTVPGLRLMREIKHNFDPAGLLSPGRFVGGI